MEYRKLPRGEEKLSVIGLGSGSLGLASEEEIEVVIKEAINSGSISLIYVLEITKYINLLEKQSKEFEKKFIFNFTLVQFIKRMTNMVGVDI